MGLISGTKGQLLRVTTFTSSGTWTKQNDVGFVIVDVVAAGGGNSSDGTNSVEVGGNSSFGSHCSANGGTAGGGGLNPAVGTGGSATGGDINFTGRPGWSTNTAVTARAESFGLYPFGAGGASTTGRPGGAGGYSQKKVDESSLGSTETVTVGLAYSGGAAGTGTSFTRGIDGIVKIYEYSK